MTKDQAIKALRTIGQFGRKEATHHRPETIEAFRAFWTKPRPSMNEFGIVMDGVIVWAEMLYLMITEPEGIE